MKIMMNIMVFLQLEEALEIELLVFVEYLHNILLMRELMIQPMLVLFLLEVNL